MRIHPYVLSLGLLCSLGCAVVAPAQLGQIVGTIAGAAAAPGVGAPIGGLVGILAGSVLQRGVDLATASRERVELREQLNTAHTHVPPAPADGPVFGEPTRVWVDEALEDGRLVAGHFEVRHLP